MPLRMLLDSGAVAPADVALVGARNLDPPEEEFIAAAGLGMGPQACDAALDGTAGMYVAVDFDALAEDDVAAFMPEPGGLALVEVELLLGSLPKKAPVLGVGFTGLLHEQRNLEPISRLTRALGF
jgi:arginase